MNKIEYEQYPQKNGYGSLDKNILLTNELKSLKQTIEDKINYFLFEILKFKQGKIKHVRSWINLHKQGDFSQNHNHPNSFISGILYLNVPEFDSGKIYFSHPEEISSFKTCTVNPLIEEYNIFNSKLWTFEPKNNMIVIFPSHLSHSTGVNNSGENRHSLAFNYFLEGSFGENNKTTYMEL